MSYRPPDKRRSNATRAVEGAVLAGSLLVAYVLSSGPVLATAFWMREATGRDGFFLALWLYYPLLRPAGPNGLLMEYILWWCNLLHTVGPG